MVPGCGSLLLSVIVSRTLGVPRNSGLLLSLKLRLSNPKVCEALASVAWLYFSHGGHTNIFGADLLCIPFVSFLVLQSS